MVGVGVEVEVEVEVGVVVGVEVGIVVGVEVVVGVVVVVGVGVVVEVVVAATTFVTYRTESEGWSVDDPRVFDLWLPAIGPSGYCALRLLHAEHDIALTYPLRNDPSGIIHDMGLTAARLGLKNAGRAQQTLERLVRRGLLAHDATSDTMTRPVYRLPSRVRALTRDEINRLPREIRALHAEGGT